MSWKKEGLQFNFQYDMFLESKDTSGLECFLPDQCQARKNL